MMENENTKAVRRLIDALHAWDADAWANLHTEDVQGKAMISGTTWSGRETAREHLLSWKETFETLHNEITGLYPSGDCVILEIIASFKLAKESRGRPAGTSHKQNEIFIYKFRDAMICESRSYG